ncbi:MAG: uracil-DNA glycosylase [bacterium]
MTDAQTQKLLTTITRSVDKCAKCRLHKRRTKSVPGAGSHAASIVFVGEAPGYNEDKQGLPFVGRAGNLLSQLLAENNIKRQEVWIGNIIKCRPPDNRDPMVDEVRACEPYLEKQIETINPKLIVTLGRFAMAHYIKEGTISENHGKVFKIKNRLVLPLYHPAAALRNTNVLTILRKDFTMIGKALKGETEVVEPESKSTNEDQLELI